VSKFSKYPYFFKKKNYKNLSIDKNLTEFVKNTHLNIWKSLYIYIYIYKDLIENSNGVVKLKKSWKMYALNWEFFKFMEQLQKLWQFKGVMWSFP